MTVLKFSTTVFLVGWAGLFAADSAQAGPPFVTDDPEPAEYRHLEAYLFAEGAHVAGATSGAAPGFEINVGAFPQTQLSIEIPLEFERVAGETDFSPGPLGFGVKYRFLNESDEGWRPQVAFYPSVEVPVAGDKAGVSLLLPLWTQKSFGDWTVFGGGGYRYNAGADKHDNWEYGIALMRPVGTRLELGVEAFGATSAAPDEKPSAGVGLGAIWSLNDRFALVGSVNKGVRNADATNDFSFYFGLRYER